MKIRREAKLAITGIAAVIILIWGINFLKAKSLFNRNNVFYGVYERVDGLKVSSNVVYRGYKVGQVNDIRFVGQRSGQVLVEFTVNKKLEIPRNSLAVIQSEDLMGSKAIDIVPGTSLENAESGDTLQPQVALGLMQQLNEQLQPLKNKAENIMTSLDSVLVVIQSLFNDNTQGNIQSSLQSIGHTLRNVEHASGNIDTLIIAESSRIASILANINSITENLNSSNGDITRSLSNIASISDSLRSADIKRSLVSLHKILGEVDSVVTKINRGKGTLGEAVNNDELYYNLTSVSDNLNKLLIEFNANPKRFVNLSVFDFTSNKSKDGDYGIVIGESGKPLDVKSELYVKHPDLKEVRRNGRFLYMIRTYKNLKQAQKDLGNVNKSYKDAYIVKIS